MHDKTQLVLQPAGFGLEPQQQCSTSLRRATYGVDTAEGSALKGVVLSLTQPRSALAASVSHSP